MGSSEFARSRLIARLTILACLLGNSSLALAQSLVPGTGVQIKDVGDDFEDAQWTYVFNNPKNSSELDGHSRLPDGFSKNRRWFEGPMRGQPDILRRVETPEGGISGSTGSLLMRSLQTGTPGRPSGKNQQDDFVVNTVARLGRRIPVAWGPSVVVRVWVPPFDEWEDRTGNSFALRTGNWGFRPKGEGKIEEYWPGMFFWFRSKTNRKYKEDSACILVRSGQNGVEFRGPELTAGTWWTLGMSFPSNGQIEYYAKEGVEDLTTADFIAARNPYGFRCESLETTFFNVINGDNGRTWSTSWIIDDPSLFLARRDVPLARAKKKPASAPSKSSSGKKRAKSR